MSEFIPASAVRKRYGNAAESTLWRWERDPDLKFPKPVVLGGGRKYWRLTDLEAWEASRPNESSAAPPKPRAA